MMKPAGLNVLSLWDETSLKIESGKS